MLLPDALFLLPTPSPDGLLTLAGLIAIPLPACAQPEDALPVPTPASVRGMVSFDYINHLLRSP